MRGARGIEARGESIRMRGETALALRDALEEADRQAEPSLIGCRVPPDDLSPLSRRYIQASLRKG